MKLRELFPKTDLGDAQISEIRYLKREKRLQVLFSCPIPEENEAIVKHFEETFNLPTELVFPKETPSHCYEQPVTLVRKKEEKKVSNEEMLGRFRKNDAEKIREIATLVPEEISVISGVVYSPDFFVSRTETLIVTFDVEEKSGAAVGCKAFYKDKERESAKNFFKEGETLILKGKLTYDTYAKEEVFTVFGATKGTPFKETDNAHEKRVELAVHTRMSNMEGLIDVNRLVARLKDWGHRGCAVTDRGSLQSYPLIQNAFKKAGLKPVYGYEAEIIRKEHRILSNFYEKDIPEAFTVFDVETTGFSRFTDRLIEIGAVRYENGEKVGEFSRFINPGIAIPERIVELTGITSEMVRDAQNEKEVVLDFLEFSKDSYLVAHNADFDIGFIGESCYRNGYVFEPVYVDTLPLARFLHPEYPNHKLGTLTKKLHVSLVNHHRACDDAQATADVYCKLLEEYGASLDRINSAPDDYPIGMQASFDRLIFVQKASGMKNLYRLVSDANMKYFHRNPRVPEDELEKYHEGLVTVEGFVGSELFWAISRRLPEKKLLSIAKKADFLCIQPPNFYEKAKERELVGSLEDFLAFTEKILDLGKKAERTVLAIGFAYYLDACELRARNILVNYQRNVEFEHKERYRLLNTDDMLHAFNLIKRPEIYDCVVTNTDAFLDSVEDMLPIPEGTFTPEIEGASDALRSLTYDTAHEKYGDPLPEIVQKRVDRELDSTISNGYASLYMIARELVLHSNADGYLVGSRGSVGSSLVAHFVGITEVNPLEPHYVCPKCHDSKFFTEGEIGCGFDLPVKECPDCGLLYERNGHNIPFEVFLGFKGNKEPDIDLNFATEYMLTIHKYTETLFGKGKVFRAGTISGVQSKTAYGFIRKYLEQPYIPEEDKNLRESDIRRLQRHMEGTRRTTGQHAGGLIVVPHEKDILDFTPIQYPADDQNAQSVTTHFSYKNLEGRLLKLDELGHTSPSIIRQLQDLTGVDAISLDFDDPMTLSIFNTTDALGIQHPYSNEKDGSLGIPEFGTNFVRGMLKDTKPSTFAELTRISGLSHGTDVWLNNAQDLVRNGTITLSEAICTRDDIMTYLILQGMDKEESFKTMESVRKGRGLPEGIEEHMIEKKIPGWYINSCKKIQYMFPKAHATAYVMMSYRIAWFKVHHPAAFYATYFTQRLSDFSTRFLYGSLSEVQSDMDHIQKSGEDVGDKWALLELIEEMYARDVALGRVDLLKSHPSRFLISDKGEILPPLACLDDVSEAMACDIAKERGEPFLSREEFKKRTNVTKNAMTSIISYGLLSDLPDTNQLSFLGMM